MPGAVDALGRRAGKGDTSRSKQTSKMAQATVALRGLVVKTKEKTRATKRLGMSDLGIFAYEKKMPSWLDSLLRRHGVVSCAGVVEALMRCLAQTEAMESAYLCDPRVRQIFKLRREGQFCGYRNIQMLASYIIVSGMPGSEHLRGRIPSIFDLQDAIEAAWRKGIMPEGLVETGGIKGTRKFIGTPEAEALLTSFGIPYKVHIIRSRKGESSADALLQTVEAYFQAGSQRARADSPNVKGTSLPPLYFQTPVHSMTIVGIEKPRRGAASLLVFDPMYHDVEGVSRAVERGFQAGEGRDFLKLYRRDLSYLGKYSEFELLELTYRSVVNDMHAEELEGAASGEWAGEG